LFCIQYDRASTDGPEPSPAPTSCAVGVTCPDPAPKPGCIAGSVLLGVAEARAASTSSAVGVMGPDLATAPCSFSTSGVVTLAMSVVEVEAADGAAADDVVFVAEARLEQPHGVLKHW
jgi:hypothetical protein